MTMCRWRNDGVGWRLQCALLALLAITSWSCSDADQAADPNVGQQGTVKRAALGGCADGDGDGHDGLDPVSCPTGTDCNDSDADTFPGAAEICGDTEDNNCDGITDEDCACDYNGLAAGVCTSGGTVSATDGSCSVPAGYEASETSCGDGVDNDCDGATDSGGLCACTSQGFYDRIATVETDGSYSVAIADFNNDGYPDVATSSRGSGRRRLYLGDGAGSVRLSWTSAEVETGLSIAAGDFNGDGNADIVVGPGLDAVPHRVYLGDGNGGLSLSYSANLPGTGHSIVTGHFNNDSHLDFAYGQWTTDATVAGVTVILGDGTGTAFTQRWMATTDADARGLAAGDLDGDGDLDLVAAHFNGPNRVYLNNGSGRIDEGWVTPESDQSVDVEVGDLDGDGDLDLVFGNDGQPNRVYLNNGTGSFTLRWSSTEADVTEALTLGDFDGNGRLDMAVGNELQPNRIYLGDGAGGFGLHWTGAVADNTEAVATADFDGDGDLDLWIANSYEEDRITTNDCQIAWPSTEVCDGRDNDGNGLVDDGIDCSVCSDADSDSSFGTGPNCAGGDCDDASAALHPNAPEVCGDGVDDDCDGIADDGCACDFGGSAIGVCVSGTVSATDGSCTAPANHEANEALRCDGLDNDCDGITDEGCACDYGGSPIGVCASGMISATDGSCSVPAGYAASESLLCDGVDNDCDGAVDEGCACDYNGLATGVCANAGIRSATDGSCPVPAGYEASEASCGDGLDNDCDGSIDSGGLCACTSAGFYDRVVTTETDRTHSVAIADFNNDGRPDAATVGRDADPHRLYLGDGTGSVRLSWSSAELDSSYSIAAGDFNGDGNADVVIGPLLADPHRVYLGDGNGGLSLSYSADLPGTGHSIVVGHFNNDPHLDFAYGRWTDTSPAGVTVMLGDGTGTAFSRRWASTFDTDARGLATGDLDGDGDLDLVAPHFGGPNRVYLNNGDGSFADGWVTPESDQSLDVEVGDLDGDGDLDLVFSNYGQPNRAYLNNGTGSFTLRWSSTEADKSEALALGDFDGNGRLDLAVGNELQPNRIYLGDGAGGFSLHWTGAVADDTEAVAVADFDGDGDLDLWAGNEYEGDRITTNNCLIASPSTEVCDGRDNDGNGLVDDGIDCSVCSDADGDGAFGTGPNCTGGDCDDANAALHPNAPEVCGDSVDNDCDGVVDDGCACDYTGSSVGVCASGNRPRQPTAAAPRRRATPRMSRCCATGWTTTATASPTRAAPATSAVAPVGVCASSGTVSARRRQLHRAGRLRGERDELRRRAR